MRHVAGFNSLLAESRIGTRLVSGGEWQRAGAPCATDPEVEALRAMSLARAEVDGERGEAEMECRFPELLEVAY